MTFPVDCCAATKISVPRTVINAQNEIYSAQIRAVYQHTPMVLAANIVTSLNGMGDHLNATRARGQTYRRAPRIPLR